MKKLLLILGAVMLMGAPLHAATMAITEGNRALVDGSTAIVPTDSSNSPPGYALGSVGFGGGVNEYTQIDIHGRIVGQADFYNFTANSNFIIEFIFDDVFVNAAEILSGFVREGNGNNRSNFVLRLNGSHVGTSPDSYITNVTEPAHNGGTSLIFSGTAGSLYTFGVNSRPENPDAAATYDIRISAVPLPAGVILLLTGLGALGIARRRRS